MKTESYQYCFKSKTSVVRFFKLLLFKFFLLLLLDLSRNSPPVSRQEVETKCLAFSVQFNTDFQTPDFEDTNTDTILSRLKSDSVIPEQISLSECRRDKSLNYFFFFFFFLIIFYEMNGFGIKI